jgi:hypothetical protein
MIVFVSNTRVKRQSVQIYGVLAGDMRNRESDWCGSRPKQAVFPNFDAEVKFEERT